MKLLYQGDKIKPFLESKLNEIEESIIDNEKRIKSEVEKYKKSIQDYKSLPFYKKIFTSHPSETNRYYEPYIIGLYRSKVYDLEREKEKIVNVVNNITSEAMVELTEDEIKYYNINLLKIG
jgi:glutamyl-tRNA reductase